MKEVLVSNFDYIQKKIEGIKSKPELNIKDISDLQRYVSMQKDIVEMMSCFRIRM